MSSAEFRQMMWRFGWLALVGASGVAVAADTLPTLRVDPTLLGGAPLKPVVVPSGAEKPADAKMEKTAEPKPAAASAPAPTVSTESPRAGVEVTPVAPPPEPRDLVPSPTVRPTTPVPPVAPPTATPSLQPVAPKASATPPPPAVLAPSRLVAAPQPVAAPVPADPVRTARNLPPLRIDPVLLGGAPLAQRPVAAAPRAELARPQSLVTAPSVKTAQNLPLLRVDPALLGDSAGTLTTVPPQIAVQPAVPPLYSAYQSAGLIPHPATTPMSHVDKNLAPTFVSAAKIGGVNDVEMTAEGDAELIRAGDVLRGDRIIYRVADDEVESDGNVVLSAPDMVISGPRMRLRMAESIGEFESPSYAIRKEQNPVMEPALTISGLPATDEKGKILVGTGRMIEVPPTIVSGTASRLEFRGKDQYYMKDAVYSTCAPGKRDWAIHLDELNLDYNSEQASGRGAALRVMDVPILYSPWLDFSLNSERKSGFLPGSIGSTNKSGMEASLPWYWNIAPDMDATITPRLMSRRGVQLTTEYRYLLDTPWNRRQHRSGGLDQAEVNVEYLPDDNLAGRDRYGYSVRYNRHFTENLKAELNLNGVSDNDYFSDLSTHVAQVSQGNLLRQGKLLYRGPWYGATFNVQTFQQLQDVTGNYRRLPQVTAYASRDGLPLGLAFDVNAEYVNFDHPTELLGKRATVYPQVSLPLVSSAFNLTPKIGFHSTQYELSGQNRLPVTDYRKNAPDQISRTLPIFSVDGGFVMERDFNWFDRSLVQTLEPRAYYLYIPKHDQSRIPVFDTALASFSAAQLFSENRYVGGDRIGDANHLTLAMTSRLLEAASGSDLLQATLGTRYYFTEQSVTLPQPFNETRRTERKADILAMLSGQVLPNIYADVAWQYNPRDEQTERMTLSGRYRPSSGQILNASYRLDRSTQLKQFDVSGQWPLFGGWQGVGRYNYSINEHRVIESIAGLEYNAACWTSRVVLQRLATIAERPTTAVFFQLELNDFSKIGSNPLQLLHRDIPGYGVINHLTADPVYVTH